MPGLDEGDDDNYRAYRSIGSNTAPFDSRHPHTNQYEKCFHNYIDFHRCKKIRGDDYMDCNYFKRVYRLVCFANQIQKWDEDMKKGTLQFKI